MKATEVRAKTADEREAQILDLRKEQLNLRIQKSTGQLENASRLRAVRRDVARLKTIQNEVKQGKAAPAPKAQKAKAAKPKAASKKKETKE